MWIHEHKNWTDLKWDTEAIFSKLVNVSRKQGQLLGFMEGLGLGLKNEARLSMLTDDLVKSWAIEGVYLNPEEVRSSIARRLGIDITGLQPTNREVEGFVEMMLDATQNFSKSLTKDRLFGWHTALFPTGYNNLGKITVGDWRTIESGPMRVISGPIGKEIIHFEAPSADKLEKEMQVFLEWFNNANDIDPIIKAGIAHFRFVTIHPFEDGNGRIARAIGDMALARADGTSSRYYSLSSQLETERKDYYNQLEKQQLSSPDITNWLVWFLDCLARSINSAETKLANVLSKAKIWTVINEKPVNDRQRIIINRMLEDDFEGFMNTSQYAELTKCSKATALRDIKKLKDRGIFIKNTDGGRSTSYRLLDR